MDTKGHRWDTEGTRGTLRHCGIPAKLSRVTQVAAGDDHTCVTDVASRLHCFWAQKVTFLRSSVASPRRLLACSILVRAHRGTIVIRSRDSVFEEWSRGDDHRCFVSTKQSRKYSQPDEDRALHISITVPTFSVTGSSSLKARSCLAYVTLVPLRDLLLSVGFIQSRDPKAKVVSLRHLAPYAQCAIIALNAHVSSNAFAKD